MWYSIMRFIEAYGLWRNRRWAEWFALISSGFFLPVEIYEMFRKFTTVKSSLFLINVGIVLYLIYALKTSKNANLQIIEVAADPDKIVDLNATLAKNSQKHRRHLD